MLKTFINRAVSTLLGPDMLTVPNVPAAPVAQSPAPQRADAPQPPPSAGAGGMSVEEAIQASILAQATRTTPAPAQTTIAAFNNVASQAAQRQHGRRKPPRKQGQQDTAPTGNALALYRQFTAQWGAQKSGGVQPLAQPQPGVPALASQPGTLPARQIRRDAKRDARRRVSLTSLGTPTPTPTPVANVAGTAAPMTGVADTAAPGESSVPASPPRQPHGVLCNPFAQGGFTPAPVVPKLVAPTVPQTPAPVPAASAAVAGGTGTSTGISGDAQQKPSFNELLTQVENRVSEFQQKKAAAAAARGSGGASGNTQHPASIGELLAQLQGYLGEICQEEAGAPAAAAGGSEGAPGTAASGGGDRPAQLANLQQPSASTAAPPRQPQPVTPGNRAAGQGGRAPVLPTPPATTTSASSAFPPPAKVSRTPALTPTHVRQAGAPRTNTTSSAFPTPVITSALAATPGRQPTGYPGRQAAGKSLGASQTNPASSAFPTPVIASHTPAPAQTPALAQTPGNQTTETLLGSQQTTPASSAFPDPILVAPGSAPSPAPPVPPAAAATPAWGNNFQPQVPANRRGAMSATPQAAPHPNSASYFAAQTPETSALDSWLSAGRPSTRGGRPSARGGQNATGKLASANNGGTIGTQAPSSLTSWINAPATPPATLFSKIAQTSVIQQATLPSNAAQTPGASALALWMSDYNPGAIGTQAPPSLAPLPPAPAPATPQTSLSSNSTSAPGFSTPAVTPAPLATGGTTTAGPSQLDLGPSPTSQKPPPPEKLTPPTRGDGAQQGALASDTQATTSTTDFLFGAKLQKGTDGSPATIHAARSPSPPLSQWSKSINWGKSDLDGLKKSSGIPYGKPQQGTYGNPATTTTHVALPLLSPSPPLLPSAQWTQTPNSDIPDIGNKEHCSGILYEKPATTPAALPLLSPSPPLLPLPQRSKPSNSDVLDKGGKDHNSGILDGKPQTKTSNSKPAKTYVSFAQWVKSLGLDAQDTDNKDSISGPPPVTAQSSGSQNPGWTSMDDLFYPKTLNKDSIGLHKEGNAQPVPLPTAPSRIDDDLSKVGISAGGTQLLGSIVKKRPADADTVEGRKEPKHVKFA